MAPHWPLSTYVQRALIAHTSRPVVSDGAVGLKRTTHSHARSNGRSGTYRRTAENSMLNTRAVSALAFAARAKGRTVRTAVIELPHINAGFPALQSIVQSVANGAEAQLSGKRYGVQKKNYSVSHLGIFNGNNGHFSFSRKGML